jgi:hypothetical protein
MSSWPTGVITKTVSAGPAILLEDGSPAVTEVTVRASRSLTFAGRPLVSLNRTWRVEAGEEAVFPLPVCDIPNVHDAYGRLIELGEDEYTHTYQVTIRFFVPGTSTPIETRQRGPFVLRQSDDDLIDLDLLISTHPPEHSAAVWIHDRFSVLVATAEQAAVESADSAAVSEAAASASAASAAASQGHAESSNARAVTAETHAREAEVQSTASAASAAASAANAAQAAVDAALARSIADRDWTGPRGARGETGLSVRVGQVQTGQPGSQASVVNVGTDQDLILNFTLPRGEVGNLSAARTWADFDALFAS